MAIKDLTIEEIDSFVGTRHPTVGFEYPSNGLQPYYAWLMRSMHLLAESSAGAWRVASDAAEPLQVNVSPGRATLDGVVVDYDGGALDLAQYNNDSVLVWLQEQGGDALIDVDSQSAGWPDFNHIKLATVTLAAGEITAIIDHRFESLFNTGLIEADLGESLAATLVTYTLEITAQGNVGAPSTVSVSLRDAKGQVLELADYLRVRVCDDGGFDPATNATIAPSGATTMVESHTADKDLVLKSHTNGVFEIGLTNAVAETVTVRIGAAPLTSRRADFTSTLDVTHA